MTATSDFEAGLAFLLEEKEVPANIQEKMKTAKMTTMTRFILMAGDFEEWRAIFKDEWGLDPAADPDNRLSWVTVMDAWEEAKSRQQEERKADAEARQAGLPKPLGKQPHQLARKAANARFKITMADRETPAQCTVDKVLAMLEDRHTELMSLMEVLCVEDVEEEPDPGVGIDKNGVIRLRKRPCTVAMPPTSEELRRRLFLLAMAYAFAYVRMPRRTWLATATPTSSGTYASYLLGNKVLTLSATTATGAAVANPSWAQVLHYDKEIRKKQAELINDGSDFESALQAASKDTEIREMHLVTPTSVQAALGAVQHLQNDRDRTPRRPGAMGAGKGGGGAPPAQWQNQGGKGGWQNQGGKGGWQNQGGKGKDGKNKGKDKHKGPRNGGGQSGGFARGLLHETHDKLQVCFGFNQHSGCRGGCSRVHICRLCGQPGHGMHEGKCERHSAA